MTRILAVADQVEEGLDRRRLLEIAPDLVLSPGDLPHGYLDFLVSTLNVPLLYVPGNHDPDLQPGLPTLDTQAWDLSTLGPAGCDNADGRVLDAAGLRVAGLGGSIRYNRGPNQYTQREMWWRALRLELRVRLRALRGGRRLDILLAHSPPLGVGDGPDPAHQGFAAFHGLVGRLRPRLLVHGHLHPYQRPVTDRELGSTKVINAVGYRILETAGAGFG